MMSDLLNKVITIIGIEKKATPKGGIYFKIKGDDNLSYKIWQKKADGSFSKAYESLQKLENEGLGIAVEIWYKEQNGTYEGKPVVYRTITMIDLADVKATKEQPQTSQNKTEKPRDSQQENIRWCNALNNAALIVSKKIDGVSYDTGNAQDEIEELANWFYNLEPIKLDTTEDRSDDEIKVENIPF